MRGIFRSLCGGLFEKELEWPTTPTVHQVFHGYRKYHTVKFRLVGTIERSLVTDHEYAIFEEALPDETP